jgi:hypothetical protein
MIDSDELAQMQSDLASVRGDRQESITITRGHGAGLTQLPAQNVRIARLGGRALVQESDGGAQVEGQVVVLGGPSLDIQVGDRFNDANGVLYEVTFVRPNRAAATMAEARAVE